MQELPYRLDPVFSGEPDVVKLPCAVELDGGDCDDLAVIAAALDLRCALPPRITWLRQEGPEDHVCCEVRVRGLWLWQEATIPGAGLGESPRSAALRLGVMR